MLTLASKWELIAAPPPGGLCAIVRLCLIGSFILIPGTTEMDLSLLDDH